MSVQCQLTATGATTIHQNLRKFVPMAKRAFADISLKNLIGEVLRSNGMEKKFDELEIAQAFRDCAGPLIARKTREIRVKDKALILHIESGPLKEELSHQKSVIIRAVNEKIGHVVIEKVEIW